VIEIRLTIIIQQRTRIHIRMIMICLSAVGSVNIAV